MRPSIDQLWQQAAREIESQQLDTAHRTLESLLERDPNHTPARMRLASLYLACGRLRLASKHAVSAARSAP